MEEIIKGCFEDLLMHLDRDLCARPNEMRKDLIIGAVESTKYKTLNKLWSECGDRPGEEKKVFGADSNKKILGVANNSV
jgi:hypothetical protein